MGFVDQQLAQVARELTMLAQEAAGHAEARRAVEGARAALDEPAADPVDRLGVAQGRLLLAALEAGLAHPTRPRRPAAALRMLELALELVSLEERIDAGVAAEDTPLGERKLQLLWYEAASVPAVRRDPRFAAVVGRLAERPIGQEEIVEVADEQADAEERREILEVVLRGAAASRVPALDLAGPLVVAPLVLLEGTLVLPFDEVDAMWATLAALTSRGARDAESEPLAKLATQLGARRSWCSAPLVEGVTRGLAARVDKRGAAERAAFDADVTRALVEARSRQRRAVFGSEHVRGLFTDGAKGEEVPVYIASECAAKLPSLARVDVRLVAELHPAVDANESERRCLRVVALAVLGLDR
jgi:hypothetical protein